MHEQKAPVEDLIQEALDIALRCHRTPLDQQAQLDYFLWETRLAFVLA